MKLIREGHLYSSQYRNGLSNHLPMALASLDFLGANESQIQKFNEMYLKNLEPVKESTATVDSVINHFGKNDDFQAVVDYFKSQLDEFGLEEVLLKTVPSLSEGISGAAFHPLIRLAFSIEIDDSTEQAHALASWVVAYQKLAGRDESRAKVSFAESLSSLKSKFNEPYKPEGYGVFKRMAVASEHENFKDFLNSFDMGTNAVKEISELVIRLYLSTKDNFTALHAVTSCHALRVVSKSYKGNFKELIRYYWQAIGAAYIDIGLPELIDIEVPKILPSWEDILCKACESTNDHIIKLVYTCREEFHHYGNNLYHLAASKKVRLI